MTGLALVHDIEQRTTKHPEPDTSSWLTEAAYPV